MELYPIYATFLVLIIPTLVFLLRKRNNSTQKRLPLPPGSLGLPIIGQSLQIFRAMRANRCEDWIRERIRKYRAVSKLNVFGNRSVLLHGPAANKFIYTCDEKVLSNQQPASVRRLMGERNLLELNGEDHTPGISTDDDVANPSPLLSDEEIADNCTIAMIAGHDTTSVLLTFLIKLLSEHPHVYQTVLNEQEEIANRKGSLEEPLTWDDLAKMKYTWKVATETLRMNPPIFCSFRRVVQDFELGGYTIPKGWQTAFMTHMDESIYPDPSTFNPARFNNQGAAPPYSFMAFGGGPRMCPGYEFARIETLTMVHYLVTRFRWKLSLEENLFGRAPLPFFHQGLPIQVEIKKPLDDDDAS